MNRNIEAYRKIASKWKQTRDGLPIANCVIEFAKNVPVHGHVLDVGCGTGYPISAWFATRGYQVTGIDAVDQMIDYAKKLNLPNTKFILTDLLNFHPHEAFDAIVAFDVLFHLPLEQQIPALRHLAKMVKPNGSMLFTHGNKRGEITGTMFNETFYYSSLNTSEYVNQATDLGFVVTTLVENYVEPTVGDRDLLMVIKRKG